MTSDMQSPTSAPSFAIRRAARGDLREIEGLLINSALPTVGVAESLEGFLVAEAGGKIVGVVGIEFCCDRFGLLRSTAVDQAWRSHGVGRRLVERVVAESEARGFHALYLLTTTAERYFPSFGFKVTTRDRVPAEVQATAEFQGACPASATVMELALVSQ